MRRSGRRSGRRLLRGESGLEGVGRGGWEEGCEEAPHPDEDTVNKATLPFGDTVTCVATMRHPPPHDEREIMAAGGVNNRVQALFTPFCSHVRSHLSFAFTPRAALLARDGAARAPVRAQIRSLFTPLCYTLP